MENISAAEVKQRMAAGEKLNLVDVREANENDDFNIGGILLPMQMIHTMQVEAIEDLKDKEVILYCRSGNRSLQAALVLEMLGFTNVKNMEGGMVEWKNLS
jgi:rhodanese-related sulfurtransferase